MFAVEIYRIFKIDYQWIWHFHWITVGVVYFVLMYPLMMVYEVIHALCFPIQARKEIWNYLEHGAISAYCEEKVSNARFILMSLASAFVLGIFSRLLLHILVSKYLYVGH